MSAVVSGARRADFQPERRLLFVVNGSPDPQTLDSLLYEDVWSARGYEVVVEYTPEVVGMRELGRAAESVSIHSDQSAAWAAFAQPSIPMRAWRRLGLEAVRPLSDSFRWMGWYWRHRLQELRPALVVVGNEVLPTGRWPVLAARSLGIPAVQLQHGLPIGWWGYVPVVTNMVFSWGPVSTGRYIEWGVTPDCVVEVGSPRTDALIEAFVVAADECLRPLFGLPTDARVLGLFEGLRGLSPPVLERMMAILQRVLEDRNAWILVKTHPAESREDVISLLARYLDMSGESRVVVHAGDLARALSVCDVVAVHTSSVGVEAAACGLPVVALDPFPGRARGANHLRVHVIGSPEEASLLFERAGEFSDRARVAAEAQFGGCLGRARDLVFEHALGVCERYAYGHSCAPVSGRLFRRRWLDFA